MKLNAQDLKEMKHHIRNIITSAPKSSDRYAGSRCQPEHRGAGTSRVSRVSQYLILAAARRDPGGLRTRSHRGRFGRRCTFSADMARAYSGHKVWQQDFLKFVQPDNYFDGVR